MNTTNIPGFTAERSLFGPAGRRVAVREIESNDAMRLHVVANFSGGDPITRFDSRSDFENNLNGSGNVSAAAEREPGGPGNVPQGYGRDCKAVPVTVCAGNRCWTEYGWVCTYYPLPRAR
jgi:hypothetical protein